VEVSYFFLNLLVVKIENPDHRNNAYINNLRDFVGKEIIVKDSLGKSVKGTCLAIWFAHLNVILQTKTEIIILKNISSIRRKI